MSQDITIVSGLPRSGTSLMMQMLDRGGMEIVTDNVRTADIDNPKGYYEFEKVKKIKEDASWLPDTRGKAFKMVSMLLFDLPEQENYKIIFMKRDLKEVLASQNKMLERLNKEPGPDDDEMAALFLSHLEKTYTWLHEQKNIEVLYINYKELMADADKDTKRISNFLGVGLDVIKMAGVIDRALYRNRVDCE